MSRSVCIQLSANTKKIIYKKSAIIPQNPDISRRHMQLIISHDAKCNPSLFNKHLKSTQKKGTQLPIHHLFLLLFFWCVHQRLTAANAAASPTTRKLPPRFNPLTAPPLLAPIDGVASAAASGPLHRRNTALRSRGAPSRTTVDTGTKGRSWTLAARMP
jgi:hypothetical protein